MSWPPADIGITAPLAEEAAVRVMYVEDCPSCGCAMVREDARPAPPALLRAASCADLSCDCHVLLNQGGHDLANAG